MVGSIRVGSGSWPAPAVGPGPPVDSLDDPAPECLEP